MSVYWGYKFFPKDIMFARTDILTDRMIKEAEGWRG